MKEREKELENVDVVPRRWEFLGGCLGGLSWFVRGGG